MSFITVAEAEAIIGTDFVSLSDSDKARFILLANTWMTNNTKRVPDPVDDVLKQASCEVIKGIQAGNIYAGIERSTSSERVKADTVEVEEQYEGGTRAISQHEQIAKALIASLGLSRGGLSIEAIR